MTENAGIRFPNAQNENADMHVQIRSWLYGMNNPLLSPSIDWRAFTLTLMCHGRKVPPVLVDSSKVAREALST